MISRDLLSEVALAAELGEPLGAELVQKVLDELDHQGEEISIDHWLNGLRQEATLLTACGDPTLERLGIVECDILDALVAIRAAIGDHNDK